MHLKLKSNHVTVLLRPSVTPTLISSKGHSPSQSPQGPAASLLRLLCCAAVLTLITAFPLVPRHAGLFPRQWLPFPDTVPDSTLHTLYPYPLVVTHHVIQ